MINVNEVCYVFVEDLKFVVVFFWFVRVVEVVGLVENMLEGFEVDCVC